MPGHGAATQPQGPLPGHGPHWLAFDAGWWRPGDGGVLPLLLPSVPGGCTGPRRWPWPTWPFFLPLTVFWSHWGLSRALYGAASRPLLICWDSSHPVTSVVQCRLRVAILLPQPHGVLVGPVTLPPGVHPVKLQDPTPGEAGRFPGWRQHMFLRAPIPAGTCSGPSGPCVLLPALPEAGVKTGPWAHLCPCPHLVLPGGRLAWKGVGR